MVLSADAALGDDLRQLVPARPEEHIEIIHAHDPEAAIRALTRPDAQGAMLYDLRGAGSSRHNQLAVIPIISRYGPVIGLVDTESAQVAEAALSAGAIDVIARTDLSAPVLRRALRYALARRESDRKLARLLLFDPDTGLPTQILFWEILSLAVRRGKRNRDFFAVLLIDIRNLPESSGDEGSFQGLAMRELAERVLPILRASDTVARFDSQQLAILAESMPRVEDIQVVAEKIIEALTPLLASGGVSVKLDSAIGISLYPTSATSAEGLLSRAADAMFQARERGANEFAFA